MRVWVLGNQALDKDTVQMRLGFREPGIGTGFSTDEGMAFREPGIGKGYSTDETGFLGNLV